MAIQMKVLIDEDGRVAGAAHVDAPTAGADAPIQTAMVAQPGQRLIEVTLDDEVRNFDADALLARVEEVQRGNRSA